MLRIILFLFCGLISFFPAFSAEPAGEKVDPEKLSELVSASREKLFKPLFGGLERLGIKADDLWKVVSKLESVSFTDYGKGNESLYGYFRPMPIYQTLSANTGMNGGLQLFGDDGNLDDSLKIFPELADTIIHEFWHAWLFYFGKSGGRNAEVGDAYKKLVTTLRRNGLDEAVKKAGHASAGQRIGKFKLTEEALLQGFANDYANESVAFFIGGTSKAIMVLERLILEENLRLNLSGRELKEILGHDGSVSELQAEFNEKFADSFVLPPFGRLTQEFSTATGYSMDIKNTDSIAADSRVYNIRFERDLNDMNSPYYYVRKLLSVETVSPHPAIPIPPETKLLILEKFMNLNLPKDSNELIERMKNSKSPEYQEFRRKAAGLRTDLLRIQAGNERELNPDVDDLFIDLGTGGNR